MVLNIESQTDLSGFYVIYNGTIINEYEGIYGISHMIEHLISHSFTSDFIDIFQEKGITWNAYTSPTNIVFYLHGLDKFISKYKYLFLDKLSKINITEFEFEIEKNILLEEYTSIFNIQSTSHVLNLHRKLFNSYNSIGKRNNIKNLTLPICKAHFEKYYSKPSKIINISKHNLFFSNIDFNVYDNNYIIKYNINKNIDIENYQGVRNKSSIVYVSPIIQDNWSVVFFLNYMLSNGINSPLYKKIRKKSGLAYFIKCNLDRLSDLSGINIISTETDDSKVDRLIYEIEDTLTDIDFLNIEMFNKTKNSILNKIEILNINRHNNADTFIKPKEWSIENNIENITFENVMETYLKYFNINYFYRSIDKQEFI